ncbi:MULTISPECIES: hypothetical protein [Rhizobium]|uniref:hypothetical protein n=1 Tax=unclassified Rhizobium TaxID=2613769 RepID=UPI001ADCFD4B|nr:MULTISPECIES: hypothetical protein [unclassified Rhizobium]MBO9102271.1 hypothetical protein [Rhizobium sp. L58/93]MBO9136887.1 hypothetical protein [Rhizobium sp. B209b/85]MBO9172311.1 hypothetical protein [Rhizobium sp. L245/93]MBO9188070.1 hypothetical protein [Rhizobium sp. E27B/91]QXZ86196.1 hypothetical protein J5287_24280 [Rhizobium sp. K1/93]
MPTEEPSERQIEANRLRANHGSWQSKRVASAIVVSGALEIFQISDFAAHTFCSLVRLRAISNERGYSCGFTNVM